MIINKDIYKCPKCKKLHFFDTSKPYSAICPVCNGELVFRLNPDCDTEQAEKYKDLPPLKDLTKDPDSPYYIPVVECPYCHSKRTHKISAFSKAVSLYYGDVYAIGRASKNWCCDACGSEF